MCIYIYYLQAPSYSTFSPQPSLHCLPDNLVLYIMSFLDALSLFRLGKVSKRFYHLHQDKSNWLAVDLTTLRQLNVQRLKKLIKDLLHCDLYAIRLRSNATSCMVKKSRPVVTPDALTDLLRKCGNIKSIVLEDCDLRVGREHLFLKYEAFRSVSILNCHTEVGWLEGVSWPNLRYLSFQDTKKISNREIGAMVMSGSCLEKVVSLNLIGNSRLTSEGVRYLCESKRANLLGQLSLSLSRTLNCDVFSYLASLPSLKELHLRGKPVGEDECRIENLPLLLPHLKLLDISGLEIANDKKLQLEQQMSGTKVIKC